jgi:hypothetical protein
MNLQSVARGIAIAVMVCSAAAASAKEPRPGLFIRTGEAFIFRIENGQPVGARRAAEEESPGQGELKAEMSARGGTMLVVTNRTGAPLNYEAYIARDEFARGSRTSVCTLLVGPFVMESWPNSLPGIRITNFEPAGDEMVCR